MPDPNTSSSQLEDRLRADIKDAQRARDQVRLDTLRLAVNGFHQEEVARTDAKHRQHGQVLTEQDRVSILEKQVKQREEAAHIYRDAGRTDQAEKEEREASILKSYLPQPLSDDELRALVVGLVSQHGKDFRAVMPIASRETKGRADGRRVQEIVRELTS
jgi:uncharacterized protein YqeY